MNRYKLIIALVSIVWAVTTPQAGGVTDTPTEIESIKAHHPGMRFQQAPRKPALAIVTDLTQGLARHYKQFRQEPTNKGLSLSVTSHIRSLTKFLTQGIYIAPATATPNIKDPAGIQYKFRKEPANRAEKTQIVKAVTCLAYIEAQTRSQFEQATQELFNNKGLTTRSLKEQTHVHLMRLAYQCIKAYLSNSKLSFEEILSTIGRSADFGEHLKVLQKHKTKKSLAPSSALKRLGIFLNTLAHRGKPITFAEFIKPYCISKVKRAKSNLSPRGPSLPQNPKELAHLLSSGVPKDVLQSAIDLLNNNNLKAEEEDDTPIPDAPPIAPPIMAPPLPVEPLIAPPGGRVVEATPSTPASEQGPSLLDAIQARQKAGLKKVGQNPEQKKVSLLSKAQASPTVLAILARRTALTDDENSDDDSDWDRLPSSSGSSSSSSQKPASPPVSSAPSPGVPPTVTDTNRDSASSSASSTISSSSASPLGISSSPSLNRVAASYTLLTPSVPSSSSKAEQKREAEDRNDKDGEGPTIASQGPSLNTPPVSVKERAAVFSSPPPPEVPSSSSKPGKNPTPQPVPTASKPSAIKRLISQFNQGISNGGASN